MQLDEPNDLLRLCYEYKIQEIPISEDGSINGSVAKDDLVSQLSHSEGFESDIKRLIRQLVNPVEEGFIDRLRGKLKDGEITGIPVVTTEGNIERTITPGVLQAEEESEEFLEQTNQLEVYEELLNQFPFPLQIRRDETNVFENDAIKSYDVDESEWDETVITLSDFSVFLYIPDLVDDVFDAFRTLDENETVDLRELLDDVEYNFLKKAHAATDSISSAAEMVGLPRQTFNYRWKNKVDESEDD